MHDAIEMKNGDICYKTALGNMGAGDLIKRNPDAKAVYIVNFRERAKRGKPARYSLSKYDDMNSEIFLSAETPVFVGFTF
jgi:hypothetical protein|tara:strand:- start:127 stop:366 length:240 start_codon:yes stop_codon:yes gene_type:complete